MVVGPTGDVSFRAHVAVAETMPVLRLEEELELARRYREHGDRACADRLVLCHLRAVIYMAYKYRGYGIALADLVGEGNIGLVEAVRRFDPDRGLRFLTYARHWIRAYMLAHALRHWSIVDMGTSALSSKLFFRLQAEHTRLSSELGDDDGKITSRLARHFHTSEERIRDGLARLRSRDASLDVPVPGGTTPFVDLLRSDSLNPEEAAIIAESAEQLYEAVAQCWPALNDRERTIVRERLLPTDHEAMSLAQIGRSFGVSRQRAQQIEAAVRAKLRRQLELLVLPLCPRLTPT